MRHSQPFWFKVILLLLVFLFAASLVVMLYSRAGLSLSTALPKNTVPEAVGQTAPLKEQSLRSEVHSGDGTVTLIRKVQSRPGQPQTLAFFVANLTGSDKTERPIYSVTAEPGKDVSIHNNSWSPDNKYLFLQETDATGNHNYLVFTASGEPFAHGEPMLDVGAFFTQKLPKYSLREATGWASPIFINVTTNEGSSYWFDVPALAFWGHR